MTYKRILFILVILLFIPGCFSAKETRSGYPIEIVTQGTFVHNATRMTFPEVVGSFRRSQILQYDASGADVSASYKPDDSGVEALITAYIFPVPLDAMKKGAIPSSALDDWFDGVKSSLVGRNPLAFLVSEEAEYITQHETTYEGKKATFAYLNHSEEEVLTHAYLFIYNGWFLQYRITHLGKHKSILEPQIARFMELLEWP